MSEWFGRSCSVLEIGSQTVWMFDTEFYIQDSSLLFVSSLDKFYSCNNRVIKRFLLLTSHKIVETGFEENIIQSSCTIVIHRLQKLPFDVKFKHEKLGVYETNCWARFNIKCPTFRTQTSIHSHSPAQKNYQVLKFSTQVSSSAS